MTTLAQIRAQAAWLEGLIKRLKGREPDTSKAKEVLETVNAVEGCIECSEDILRLDVAGDPIPPEAA